MIPARTPNSVVLWRTSCTFASDLALAPAELRKRHRFFKEEHEQEEQEEEQQQHQQQREQEEQEQQHVFLFGTLLMSGGMRLFLFGGGLLFWGSHLAALFCAVVGARVMVFVVVFHPTPEEGGRG